MKTLIQFYGTEHPSYTLLVDHLMQVRHDDIDALCHVPTPTIVRDTYCQFYLHLNDTMPFLDWFNLFKNYCEGLFVALERPKTHFLLCLRSYEFVEFTKRVPGTVMSGKFCLN